MILRAVCLSVALMASTAVHSQTTSKPEVSDKVLKTLKSLAWQSLPSKILQSDKSILAIDKSDPSKIIIPDDDAREIIKAAHLTARAHKCDLQELVVANRDALLIRERQKNKWSPSQLQYINSLHLYTVQLLVGKVEAVDETDKRKPEFDAKTAPMPADGIGTCSDKEKQDILVAVEANEKLLKKS